MSRPDVFRRTSNNRSAPGVFQDGLECASMVNKGRVLGKKEHGSGRVNTSRKRQTNLGPCPTLWSPPVQHILIPQEKATHTWPGRNKSWDGGCSTIASGKVHWTTPPLYASLRFSLLASMPSEVADPGDKHAARVASTHLKPCPDQALSEKGLTGMSRHHSMGEDLRRLSPSEFHAHLMCA